MSGRVYRNREAKQVLDCYVCGDCGGAATQEHGHVRVDHFVWCRRWKMIETTYPGLARQIVNQRRKGNA